MAFPPKMTAKPAAVVPAAKGAAPAAKAPGFPKKKKTSAAGMIGQALKEAY